MKTQTTTQTTALPDAVQNLAVGVDADIHIGHDDVVEVTRLLVLEEGVRHPDLLRVRHGQVLDLAWK